MPKVIVTQQTLEHIIRLRQEGSTWKSIGVAAKVPRRTAKRLFEAWQRATSVIEMDAVRRDIARDELRRHLDAMSWLAQGLVAHLTLEDAVRSTGTAEEHLKSLWTRGIPDRLVPGGASFEGDPSEGQAVRRNQLLFRALKEHARGVDWRELDSWKAAWNAWGRPRTALEKTVLAAVGRLSRAYPDLEDRVFMGLGAPHPVERLAAVAVEALSRGFLSANADDATGWVAGKTIEHGGKEVLLITLGGDDSRIPFRLDAEGMEVDFVDAYRKMILSVWDNAAAKRMKAAAVKLRQAESYFTERLDPLVLGPMALKVKCNMCPA